MLVLKQVFTFFKVCCSIGSSFNPLELCSDHFLAGFAGQGVLNKDQTVWLDGARPTPISLIMSLINSCPSWFLNVARVYTSVTTDRLWHTGQNLGRIFNSRLDA